MFIIGIIKNNFNLESDILSSLLFKNLCVGLQAGHDEV